MVILGLVLVLLALALGATAFYGLPTSDTRLTWHFWTGDLTISTLFVFFLGAVTMLGLLLGLWLLLAGTRRSARKARELRELKKSQKEHARRDEQARAERERAAAHLDGATRATTTDTL